MLQVSPSVARALSSNQPVVALESTIITHGMPYPQNVETAFRVESIVREHGAIPATCAILDGQLCAGLSPEQIEYLGKNGKAIPKASRRDLPYLVSQGKNGATTVASTMIVAQLAGIRIFATGGIGGVHRGAQETMDISADLQELAQCSVAVVCAGAKSILDIGLTLEYLETYGIPVIGYKTNDFPAFYAQKSGFTVDYRLDSPIEIANLIQAKWRLNLNGGLIIANPVPEQDQLDPLQMEKTIVEALKEAEKQQIRGKDITPFLLAQIEKLSGGKSLSTNIELICNNAALAAQIAVGL